MLPREIARRCVRPGVTARPHRQDWQSLTATASVALTGSAGIHHNGVVSTPSWPDPEVHYEYPGRDESNELRWQKAIADALTAGTLRMLPKGRKGGDFYDLVGQCPRCSHKLDKEIEFGVILGFDKSVGYNVECNCTGMHEDRPESKSGCGWGGWIEVAFSRPVS